MRRRRLAPLCSGVCFCIVRGSGEILMCVDRESSRNRPTLLFRLCPACFLLTAVCLKRLKYFRKLRLAAAEEGCRGKYAADAGDSANGIISIPKRVSSQDTSVENGLDLPLEIAHLLLIDVLGYSKLLVNEKIELLQELNYILHSFRVAEAIGYA